MGPGEASPSNGQVTIPSVFGMTREQAVATLHRAGFAGDITFDDNLCGSAIDGHVVELGLVCYQHPAAGAVQGSRLPMMLRLQTENPWFGGRGTLNEWRLMPPIVGMSLDDARATMRKVGYTHEDRVGVVWVDEPGCKPLTVCHTIPDAYTRSGLNSDRLVYVGRDPNAKPPPDAPRDKDAAAPDQPKPAPSAESPTRDKQAPEPKKEAEPFL